MDNINFKKYGSIENLSNNKFLNAVHNCFFDLPDKEFVVLEKAHGAHFSFQTNGQIANCARRNNIIQDDEIFYEYDKILAKHLSKILQIFKLIKNKFGNAETIQIDGELIGGEYPHPDIEQLGLARIQTGVYYCPDYRFYAYDIKYFDNIWQYVDYDICMDIFSKLDILYAKPLQRGKFKDVINYDPTFQTTIPHELNLPEIKNNIAEGVVIKPMHALYLPSGSRVIFKNKTDSFGEIKKKSNNPIVLKDIPDEIIELMDEILRMITQNRLNNVISKIDIITSKDMGKLIGLLAGDVIEEYNKIHGKEKLKSIDKKNKKKVTKKLANECKILVGDFLDKNK